MRFLCTKAMSDYMSGRKRHTICVEVAKSDHSDFEVTELYLRLITDDFAEYLKEKKHYREFPLEPEGRVLLPPYRLRIDDCVIFDRRKRWIFPYFHMEGIHL